MMNYQTSTSIESCLLSLDNILASPTLTSPQISMAINFSKFRAEVQIYSDEKAKSILTKLIERNKSNVPKKNWKVQQTNLLCFVVDRYQTAHGLRSNQFDELDWQRVSECIPNRDESACKFKYLSLISPNISQKPWSYDQSQVLFKLVQSLQQESINWKQISEKLYEFCQQKIYRTGKQCREHYTCYLRPNLKKGQWTSEEDYVMICLFLKYGKKWSKMTKFIEGRNQNAIKNRFFLIFQNKAKARLSNSDLIKLVKRKKEKLEKAARFMKFQTVSEVDQCINQMPNVQLQNQRHQQDWESYSQHQQVQINMFDDVKKKQIKIEVEQKYELDFTEDFQKYIDF